MQHTDGGRDTKHGGVCMRGSRETNATAAGPRISVSHGTELDEIILFFTAAALCASSAMARRTALTFAAGQALGRNHRSLTITNEPISGQVRSLGYDRNRQRCGATVTVYLNGDRCRIRRRCSGRYCRRQQRIREKFRVRTATANSNTPLLHRNNGEGVFFALKQPASSPATISAVVLPHMDF